MKLFFKHVRKQAEIQVILLLLARGQQAHFVEGAACPQIDKDYQ